MVNALELHAVGVRFKLLASSSLMVHAEGKTYFELGQFVLV
jgi:hypothetical protein